MKLTKTIYIILILMLGLKNISKSQEVNIDLIDTTNYYDFSIHRSGNQKYLKGSEIKSHFLLKEEVIPILISELKKSNHEFLSNVMYKLENGQYITIDIYDPKRDIGFIYIEILKGGGSKMRKIRSPYIESHNAEYVQCVRSKGGEITETKIVKKLPHNIKILWAEWYWYEYTDNESDNIYLITKSKIEKILRQDISKYN